MLISAKAQPNVRAALLATALLAVLTAVFFVRPHATPGPPMRDFEAYYAAGAVWNAGGDPYSQAIWSAERSLPGVDGSRYEALPFVAPPALLPLLGAIAKMPFPVANALWRCALVAAIGALGFVTLRLARRRATLRSFTAIALAAIGFGPLTSALALGQLALPATLFASLAVAWPAAAFAAWMQPNVGIALVSQVRGWIGAAIFSVLCVFVEGASGLQHYAQVVHRHSLAERFTAIQITPAAIAYGFGAAPALANAVGVVLALSAVCAWIVLLRRARDAAARFCITCALAPLAMPFFHEHDLVLVFVPAVVYATRCPARWWNLAAFGALLAGTDWLGLAQRPDGAVQTILLISALACALLALRETVELRMLIAPAAVLVLIAGASILASIHPAPVWPDAMGALAHNVAAMDLASAWNAQQRAAGLLQPEPVWALLRCFSLLGCALTALAIALSWRYPAGSKSPSPAQAANS